ncbi:DMT family transporter [Granulosicoccaceae sp. 1_MG-2023]|nr:DMT family transporter [Granulosicoccaceae sp. 1_MG-2023]
MNKPLAKSMSAAQWALLFGLSMLWGASFFLIAVALGGFAPLTLVCLRLSIAAVLLWILVRLLNKPLPRRAAVWWAFLVMGLFNNAVPFALITWGQTQIPSALASILNATTPLWTVLVAGLFLSDERINAGKLSGVICGIAGVAMMLGSASSDSHPAPLSGQLAIIGAALSYAVSAVFGRRFARWGVSPLVVAAGMCSAAALQMLPLVMFVESPLSLPLPSLRSVGALLVLALVSTALAYILYFRLLASAGATNIALVTLLVPVWAILLGVLVLGESLHSGHYAGMVLIALGLSAIDGRLWRRRPVAGERI